MGREDGKRAAKWRLLNDPAVKSWLGRVAVKNGRSKGTVKNYLNHLNQYIGFVSNEWKREVTPSEIVNDAKNGEEALERHADLMAGFIEHVRGKRDKQGRKARPYTVRCKAATVRSFYKKAVGRRYVPDVDLPKRGKPDNASRIVTADEFRTLIDKWADVKEKAVLATIAFGGLRAGAFKYLKYRDLEKGRSPAKLMVRAKPYETGETYFTFLTEKAVEFIETYLEERRVGTEKIDPEPIEPDSPLFVGFDAKTRKTVPMSEDAVERLVRRLRKKAKLEGKVTPHSFRKFFHTQLVAGGLPAPWANKLSGRVTERGAGRAYDLPSEEELRDKYLEASSRTFDLWGGPSAELEALKENGQRKADELAELRATVSVLMRAVEDLRRNSPAGAVHLDLKDGTARPLTIAEARALDEQAERDLKELDKAADKVGKRWRREKR